MYYLPLFGGGGGSSSGGGGGGGSASSRIGNASVPVVGSGGNVDPADASLTLPAVVAEAAAVAVQLDVRRLFNAFGSLRACKEYCILS